jgi:DNA polymerase (family 10)
MLEWLKIPGLGPKKARAIHVTLGISTLEELEQAAKGGRLRDLPGFGATTEAKILSGIARVREHAGRFLRPVILDEAKRLISRLAPIAGVARIEVAGSARRGASTSKDVDLVATADDAAQVMEAFVTDPGVVEVVGRGPTKCSVRLAAGPTADLRVVSAESYPFALLYFSGSKAHNVALRGRAQARGLKLNEYALIREADGGSIPCDDETAIYRALSLPYIPPELREDTGDRGCVNGSWLITRDDPKGILHRHSTWSDGTNLIEEMALAARAMGHLPGLCDHRARRPTQAGCRSRG